MSETKELCHTCGKAAESTCRMCGRPTCSKHLKGGMCESCLKGRS